MTELRCKCCGALMTPRDGQWYLKCDYCGASYERDSNSRALDSIYKLPEIQYKLIEPGFIQRIAAEVVIPEHHARLYNDAQLDYYVRNQMAEQIAKHIAEHIKIYTDIDIMNAERHYQGMVKLDTRSYGA